MATRYQAGFITGHEAAMAKLLDVLPLTQQTIRMYGKEIAMPRLTSWHGDAGAYTYSGRTFEPSPWIPELIIIRNRLNRIEGVEFNSVLINFYRDGSDSVAWHADDEPELGPSDDDVRIASVSLGASRRFVLKTRDNDGWPTRQEWDLGAGSLLVMSGTLQRTHVHSVPKTRKPVGPRMNLTFRCIR